MLDIAFQYSYERNAWEKCTNTDYIEKDIEKLPVVALFEDSGYPDDGLYVYCPKHNKEELVDTICDERVVSREGCILEGLLSLQKRVRNASYNWEYFEYAPYWCRQVRNERYIWALAFMPFQWRIFQRSASSSINIAADVLEPVSVYGKYRYKWYNFAFSIDVVKRKVFTTKVGYGRDSIEWTEIKGFDIPDIVVNTAIDAMREGIKNYYGIKPSVLSQMKGKNKIRAYIERPFDLNIVYLKQFFNKYIHEQGQDVFEKIFPYEEKNNYKIICELLAINPPKSLRKAYSFNPYAIVWYMIFKQWKIKDVNFMQKFFLLDDCIANMYLNKFYYNPVENRVTRTMRDALDHWKAVEFYCQWLLEKKGERKMLKWLYDVSTKNLFDNMQWDIIMSFHQYYEELSEEVKLRLLRDGLTEYVHDAISMEVTALSENWQNIRIKYSEEILAYECRMDNYEFRLVHNTGMLPKLGAAFNNCVATYWDRVVHHKSIIVYVKDKMGYSACIEIEKDRYLVQALGKYNRKLQEDVNRIVYFWAKHNHLMIADGVLQKLGKEELDGIDEIEIERIPYIKAIDEMNLEELLNIDNSKIKKGYYLRLEALISKSDTQRLSAPYWMKFTDEKSCLMYLEPKGKPIYNAAFQGDVEAMIALGFLYDKGKSIKRNPSKALHWFVKAAESGSKEAESEVRRLKYLKKQPERDAAILQALYKLRHRRALGEV